MTLTPDPRATPRGPVENGASPSSSAFLRERYEAYCQRQSTLLLEVIPREAVRPLYRHARAWAIEGGLHESKDPMATLRGFCREILPLPSFEVWCSDYESHRSTHESVEVSPSILAGPMEPVTVDVRRIQHDGEPWEGTLEVYRGEDAWRGLIRFRREGGEGHLKTGEIFCENDLQDLRDRFVSFTASTMSAFLRSTLP